MNVYIINRIVTELVLVSCFFELRMEQKNGEREKGCPGKKPIGDNKSTTVAEVREAIFFLLYTIVHCN